MLKNPVVNAQSLETPSIAINDDRQPKILLNKGRTLSSDDRRWKTGSQRGIVIN
jgi:hypothetical protein